MKKGALITAIILIVVGIAVFTGAIFAAGGELIKLIAGTAETKTSTYEPSGAFDKIVIDTEETDVELKPSTDGKTSVVVTEREKIHHSVVVNDGTLTIRQDDTRDWTDRIGIFTTSLHMTVYLPETQYEALNVECNTGDVTIRDAFKFGSVRIENSTGKITLEDVQAGEMNLTVSTGKISLGSVTCEKTLAVETSTGDVKLSQCDAQKFYVRTTTGDVTFTDSDAREIDVKTTTGKVTGTIRTPKVFSARSTTGKISIPPAGSDGTCEISTTTGKIDISLSE